VTCALDARPERGRSCHSAQRWRGMQAPGPERGPNAHRVTARPLVFTASCGALETPDLRGRDRKNGSAHGKRADLNPFFDFLRRVA
jgi:hypothetical protein